jgi:hypothetical protein
VRALCYLLVDLVWPADKPKNKLIRLDDDDEEEFDEVPGIDFLCNFVQSEVWSCRLYLGNQRKSDGMALCVSEHKFFFFGVGQVLPARALFAHCTRTFLPNQPRPYRRHGPSLLCLITLSAIPSARLLLSVCVFHSQVSLCWCFCSCRVLVPVCFV